MVTYTSVVSWLYLYGVELGSKKEECSRDSEPIGESRKVEPCCRPKPILRESKMKRMDIRCEVLQPSGEYQSNAGSAEPRGLAGLSRVTG